MLPYGMTKDALDWFGKKHNLIINHNCDDDDDEDFDEDHRGISITFKESCNTIDIRPVYGDCTAFYIYNISTTKPEHLENVINVIIDLMSYSGRINCFFTLHGYCHTEVLRENFKKKIEILKKLPIVGLHLQHGNRENLCENKIQIAGIIKCHFPYIREYRNYNGKCKEKHNPNTTDHLIKLRKEYNL